MNYGLLTVNNISTINKSVKIIKEVNLISFLFKIILDIKGTMPRFLMNIYER